MLNFLYLFYLICTVHHSIFSYFFKIQNTLLLHVQLFIWICVFLFFLSSKPFLFIWFYFLCSKCFFYLTFVALENRYLLCPKFFKSHFAKISLSLSLSFNIYKSFWRIFFLLCKSRNIPSKRYFASDL
jgi:hypothetical protein